MANEAYLITLATGRQGAATATELRKKGKVVHALVRDKTTAPAKALEKLGCILFEGTPNDEFLVGEAMNGVSGLFLNIFANSEDPNAEWLHTVIFLTAAVAAKTVISVVVSTVLNCSKHAEWVAEDPDYPMCYYYSRKFELEKAVRESGIKYYTILRPSFLMHNYLEPLCRAHFPNYGQFTLDVAYPPGTKTAHFDAYDVGRFAAAALLDPKQFDNHEIELGNEQLTIEQVAEMLREAVDERFSTNHATADEVALWKNSAPALAIRLWGEKEGAYTNDPKLLDQYGIPLTKFTEFAVREKVAIQEAIDHWYFRRSPGYQGNWENEGRGWGKQGRGEWGDNDEGAIGGNWEEGGDWETARVTKSNSLEW